MESNNSAGPSSNSRTYGFLTIRNDLIRKRPPSNQSKEHIPIDLLDPGPIQEKLPTNFLEIDSTDTMSCKDQLIDTEYTSYKSEYETISKETDIKCDAPLLDIKQEGWLTLAAKPIVTRAYDPQESNVKHTSDFKLDEVTEEVETNSDICSWGPASITPGYSNNILISVKETSACRFSKYTGWHLLRATGLMNFTIYSRFLSQENIIRLTLKRSHPDYSDFPIDRICINHQSSAPFNAGHVLQPGPNEENWIFGAEGQHKSLIYFLNKTQTSKELEIRIWCSDTCRTNSSLAFQPKEISRDSNLEISIENKVTKQTIETRTIRVWTKSAIKLTDLQKKVRREDKGALAIKRKLELRVATNDPTTRAKANEIIQESCKQLSILGFTDKEMLLMFKNGVTKHEAFMRGIRFETMLKHMGHNSTINK